MKYEKEGRIILLSISYFFIPSSGLLLLMYTERKPCLVFLLVKLFLNKLYPFEQRGNRRKEARCLAHEVCLAGNWFYGMIAMIPLTDSLS